MSIFRKYDIRGEYPSEIDEEKVEGIAKAAANLLNLQGGQAAVGMDVRKSSSSLKAAVIEGLLDQGCDVIDIGLVATPMLYYEVVADDLDAGFMVSASHLPKEKNGIKICKKGAIDLTYETGIEKIKETYQNDFESMSPGKTQKEDIKEKFIQKILSKVDLSGNFKLVLDPGNGCAALVVEDLFEGFGCDLKVLNSKPDGNYPGRGPDPAEKIDKVKEEVRKENADLGIAFDGDADRAIFINEKGEKVENDMILSLFVKNYAELGDSIVHDVTCSKTVEDVIKEVGAKDINFRVGHSYIKREMVKREAKLAGEYSGHFYFRENDYYDDSFLATAKLLEIMDKEGALSKLVDELPQYYSKPEMRIECSNKEEIPEKLKQDFSDHRIVDIDGAKIYFDKGWALVRPSGTEDKISVRFEAETQDALQGIKDKVMEKVEGHLEK